MEKTVSEAIAYRRSTRVYKSDDIDTEMVKQCIENAALAPNSSNLQLWEFYHVINQTTLDKISTACFNQNAAKTARQMVVVVTRKDLWKSRAKANRQFLDDSFSNIEMTEKLERRKKMAKDYYSKVIPTIYFDVFGILGFIKYLIFQVVGLFRPIYRQTRLSDMRIVAHKSAALAAENFMISMAAIGYDTCPMEGSDTLRIKKILGLPQGAEINMVIGCGLRDDTGIYGPRFRVPFEAVYKAV
jgi:nitroreductase